MENQHQKIDGYRDLTQEEIDLMNTIKDFEARVIALHREVGTYLAIQASDPKDVGRQDAANARRWLAESRTDLEKGFMCLVRAVAQPQPREV